MDRHFSKFISGYYFSSNSRSRNLLTTIYYLYAALLFLSCSSPLQAGSSELESNDTDDQTRSNYHSRGAQFFTTVPDGTTRKSQYFDTKEDVYIHALPAQQRYRGGGWPDGDYVFQAVSYTHLTLPTTPYV